MGIFRRMVLATAAISAAVILVFIGLALLQFIQIRSGLERERLAVLADHTATPFEAAAKIGLPLSTVRNVDAILERARQTDDAISAVYLLGADGEIVQSSPRQASSRLAQGILGGMTAAAARDWSGQRGSDFFFGTKIPNASGGVAGAVLIEYSGADSVAGAWAMAGQLATAGILFVLVSLLASALLLRASLRGEIRRFDEIDSDIRAFERDRWREAPSPPASPNAGAAGLRDLLEEAEEQYRLAKRAATPEGGQCR